MLGHARPGPPREIGDVLSILGFLGPWRKWLGMAPNGAGSFFPPNPDLADILSNMDLDFENFHF